MTNRTHPAEIQRWPAYHTGTLINMDILRTPESCFDTLADLLFPPHYLEIPSGTGSTLRIHYVDEGPRNAPVVLMLHGEPTWSFLYRDIIKVVTAGGLRAIAPDLVGFGRSDKPTKPSDYTFARHVEWTTAILAELALPRIALLCQDWGGLIGLRLVASSPQRFSHLIAMNTTLPTGDRTPPAAFLAWQRFAREDPHFQIGPVIQKHTRRTLAPRVLAAYEAPFPDPSYLAGARQFPALVPTHPDDPASAPNRAAWHALGQFERPVLTLFGDSDPFTAGAEKALQRKIPGARGQPHALLPAGHFLQEDVAEKIGRRVVAFVTAAAPGA